MKRQKSKRMREIVSFLKGEGAEEKSVSEAVNCLQGCPSVKFDQTVEMALRLGVDPKKSDQQVRGTVVLPHGTGKKNVILVFARGEKVEEALAAGADYAGDEEYVQKILAGWMEVSLIIATPDRMREVGKLGKILGPRGLMPSPKAGTVTQQVGQAVEEFKRGKVQFKVDRDANIHLGVGKLSFDCQSLVENVASVKEAVMGAKPATAKGTYIRSCVLSSSMGPGISIRLG